MFLLLLLAPALITASISTLVFPKPKTVTGGTANVKVAHGRINVPSKFPWLKQMTKKALKHCKIKVKVTVTDSSVVSAAQYDETTKEGYTLQVTAKGVQIVGETVIGAIWGIQTLKQITKGHKHCKLPNVKITDSPAYPVRGLLLDTSRNFFSVAKLKTIIDGLSLSKMNTFHWHIIDAQSFPLEVKSGPLAALTSKQLGIYGPNMYYKQDEIKMLVDYAFKKGVRIVPEFDMPGHTSVWSLALDKNDMVCSDFYGDQVWSDSNGNCAEPPCGQIHPSSPSALKIVQSFLEEMMQIFPSPIIHTGADEVNSGCYGELISEFPQFQKNIGSILAQNKRRGMVWGDQILAHNINMNKGSIIQFWGTATDAPKFKSFDKIVVSPNDKYYLDCGINYKHSWCAPSPGQIFDWKSIFDFKPSSLGLGDAVIGGEVPMWTEHVDEKTVDYVVFPRASAAGARLWMGDDVTVSDADAQEQMQHQNNRLRAIGLKTSDLGWKSTNGDKIGLIYPGWCDISKVKTNFGKQTAYGPDEICSVQ